MKTRRFPKINENKCLIELQNFDEKIEIMRNKYILKHVNGKHLHR